MTEKEFMEKLKALGASDSDIAVYIAGKQFFPLEKAYAFYVEHCVPKEDDTLRDYRINGEGYWVDD